MRQIILKSRKRTELNSTILITALNVNGLNISIKRQGCQIGLKTKTILCAIYKKSTLNVGTGRLK